MFRKVLVPLDGSDVAELILPYVSQIAKGLDIPLVLFSTVEASTPDADRSQLVETAEKEAEKRLQAVADRLAQDKVRTEVVVALGRPAEQIAEAAERRGCDLIAMTTRGRRVTAIGTLGSVTDKVVHSSPIPVLTITPEKAAIYIGSTAWLRAVWRSIEPGMSKIMLPLDGSRLAEAALPYAEELARKLSLKILLVRVVEARGSLWMGSFVTVAEGEEEEEVEAQEGEATEYLEAVGEKLRANGLDVRWEVLTGHPAMSLVERSYADPHDIIALATHTGTRWKQGSVAETLVRGTGDPILVVMPPKRTDKST